MNSNKQKNKILKSKDYLFLTICLIIFFTGSTYFLGGENIPKDINLIYVFIVSIILSTLIVLVVLKKLADEL